MTKTGDYTRRAGAEPYFAPRLQTEVPHRHSRDESNDQKNKAECKHQNRTSGPLVLRAKQCETRREHRRTQPHNRPEELWRSVQTCIAVLDSCTRCLSLSDKRGKRNR